jgi:hypothetical protein
MLRGTRQLPTSPLQTASLSAGRAAASALAGLRTCATFAALPAVILLGAILAAGATSAQEPPAPQPPQRQQPQDRRNDAEPAVALQDADGTFMMTIEKADISKLRATGWQPPMPITMKAHDGKTDICGLLFRPTNFDPARKYPIVNNVYPGPQTGSTGNRAFAAARGDRQALAELGFKASTWNRCSGTTTR